MTLNLMEANSICCLLNCWIDFLLHTAVTRQVCAASMAFIVCCWLADGAHKYVQLLTLSVVQGTLVVKAVFPGIVHCQ